MLVGVSDNRIISIMQYDTDVTNGFFHYEIYQGNLYVMASKTSANDYSSLNSTVAKLRIVYI